MRHKIVLFAQTLFALMLLMIVLTLLATEVGQSSEYTSKNDIDAKVAEAIISRRTPPSHPKYNFSLFSINEDLLEKVGLQQFRYVTLNEITVKQFVFATAADGVYLHKSIEAMATVQNYYPGRKIIFYDLDKYNEKNPVKTLCNVEYRVFPFSKYPKHVSFLNTYAWKPLIILDVLRQHPGVLWFDSSIRFLSANLSQTFDKLLSTDGVLLFNYAGHNTYSVTHPTTFTYLPSDQRRLQQSLQYEANLVMVYGTRSIVEHVVKWWVFCALIERCIAPTTALVCREGFQSLPAEYAGCHRFDQTVLNILLANVFQYDHARYAKHYDHLEAVHREGFDGQTAKYC